MYRTLLFTAALALTACPPPDCEPPLGATTRTIDIWDDERGTGDDGTSIWCGHAECAELAAGSVVVTVPTPTGLHVVTTIENYGHGGPTASSRAVDPLTGYPSSGDCRMCWR